MAAGGELVVVRHGFVQCRPATVAGNPGKSCLCSSMFVFTDSCDPAHSLSIRARPKQSSASKLRVKSHYRNAPAHPFTHAAGAATQSTAPLLDPHGASLPGLNRAKALEQTLKSFCVLA